MIDAQAVIDNAREWLGVPFLHQGRSRHGADCLGFIAACLNELGSHVFLDYLPRNYARNPQALLMTGLNELTREIELQPAALIVIKFPLHAYPSHAAIYTGASMIHCDQASRGVVEHGYREPWLKRTTSIWALPGVMYT